MTKCTRCNRGLKNIQYIDGSPYGPVCFAKMGGVRAASGNAKRTKKVSTVDDGQEKLFDIDMGVLELRVLADAPTVVYTGTIFDGEERAVTVSRSAGTYDLNPRHDLANHSPTGFCWGYGGSGPAQLALAILADYLRDAERALSLYQDFKFRVIAGLKMDEDFRLTARQIENAITAIEVERFQRKEDYCV